jgi:exopolyphosphatase/guanosine-5'-triphosphate,3'-diphosphate pyrophosphatase
VKVAAIDIGTNSVLLLIAERRGTALEARVERASVTRLGQGVDSTRELNPEASQRTLACLRGYAELIAEHGVARTAAVGTSALRDARGGADFLDAAEQLLGVRPRVISGEDEARLTFAGALIGLPISGEATVFDVGGGSTEIVQGFTGSGHSLQHAQSLNIGTVRLTERYIHTDPPSALEIGALRAFIQAELARAPRPTIRGPLVGVAGTVTQLAALQMKLPHYEAARVHGSGLTQTEVLAQFAHLSALSAAERRLLPGMEPARADVIVAGALLVSEILSWLEQSLVIVSDRGVRWGLAAEEIALISTG